MSNNKVRDIIKQAAKTENVDSEFLLAIAQIESNFDLDASSHTSVQGLFQIIGATWKEVMGEEAYSKDATKQATAAARYIKKLKNEFKDDWLVTLAYNAGPEPARRARKLHQSGVSQVEASRKATFDVYNEDTKTNRRLKKKFGADFATKKSKEASAYFGRFQKAKGTTTSSSTEIKEDFFLNKNQKIDSKDDFLHNMGGAFLQISRLETTVKALTIDQLKERLAKIGIKRK